jgi:hypothetical protein
MTWFGQETGLPFDQLLGPYGLVVFLLVAFYWLGRFAFKQIEDMRRERDFWRDKSLQLLETASSAVNSAVKLAPEHDIEEMAKVVDAARRRGDIR